MPAYMKISWINLEFSGRPGHAQGIYPQSCQTDSIQTGLNQTGIFETLLHCRIQNQLLLFHVSEICIYGAEAAAEQFTCLSARETGHDRWMTMNPLFHQVFKGPYLKLESLFVHTGQSLKILTTTPLETYSDMQVGKPAKVPAVAPVAAENNSVGFEYEPVVKRYLSKQVEEVFPV